MPLEQQERRESFDKGVTGIDQMKALMLEAVAAKRTQCLKAFGNMQFCDCLADNSPPFVDFMNYVAIVVAPKDEAKYASMSTDDKKLYDATREARDKCVNWQGKPAKSVVDASKPH